MPISLKAITDFSRSAILAPKSHCPTLKKMLSIRAQPSTSIPHNVQRAKKRLPIQLFTSQRRPYPLTTLTQELIYQPEKYLFFFARSNETPFLDPLKE